jgi:hypothetical protein
VRDERARKVARNESMFRSVNEQLERINRGIGQLTGRQLRVVCECGDLACTDQLDVSLARYEEVRSDADLFIVEPGHEAPDVEDVINRTDGVVVVRKRPGEGQRVARETDPRT